MAGDRSAWDRIVEVAGTGQRVEGRAIRVITGGLILDLDAVPGFLPAHLIEDVPDAAAPLSQYEGRSLNVAVIELNRARENCVVTARR